MMQNMNDMQDMICDAYACSGRKKMNKAVTWQTKHATGKMRGFPETDARFANGKQKKNDTNLRLTA